MSAQDDGLIKRYREANEHDAARPGAHVRGAVRAHAQMLAAAAVAAHNSPATDPVRTTSRTAANSSRWKISALATVALVSAILAGLLATASVLWLVPAPTVQNTLDPKAVAGHLRAPLLDALKRR